MSFIDFRNVWLEYGDSVVLEKLSLRIGRGEFCVVVGAQGCGKSSLLRLLLGRIPASRGRILLDGVALESSPVKRGLVYPADTPDALYPHLNLRDNLLLGLELQRSRWFGRLFGASRERQHEKVEAMVDLTGLRALMHKMPAQLSPVSLQRLAIAQSLIVQPQILLLDDPFHRFDVGARKDLHAMLLDLWKRTGITVLMTTRDLSEGFALGTRLLALDKPSFDPRQPTIYGSRLTYDIQLNRSRRAAVPDVLPADLVEKLVRRAPGA
ncbi:MULTISPECIES: ATP-binding cassette domain-containing protein [Hydrocarboniphaga]|uniref:ABC transporter domain-containing protein n=1 Tax=Hydrocarboniphaga effusa AP103 TaxID=1172194 RepID=I7ZFF1_9GAMM|nr:MULTISPECIES: ATP-binding cassette domain-containing protein [Hydrocarboniphaga]EIT70624.1 hypothetical protein WQQ_07610 [Hydrocarboniphaga effusa AP103]MDZ4081243.1 ATP-binding cassette domain-containing protein [Hydrocarboniphaga sp.]